MNDVAIKHDRDAKAEPGSLADPDLPGPEGQPDAGRGQTAWFTRRPAASAVLPAVTGRRSRLSLRRNTPLANLMVNARPARAVTGMRTPQQEDAGHD